MKAFVLSIHENGPEGDMDNLAVVVAYDREEALRLLGSRAGVLDDITPPTNGVNDEVRRKCEEAARRADFVSLEEIPLVHPLRLI